MASFYAPEVHLPCILPSETIYTSRPNTLAGIELNSLAKDLLDIKTKLDAGKWIDCFVGWLMKYREFLSEMTMDEYVNRRPKHERMIKAER